MKYKYVLSIFIVGLLFWLFAAWSKITHQSYAALMVNISFIIMGLAGVFALIKILFNKNDNFLNR
jgi:uncharacterized membrane protein YuzA (DUF378 family)